MLAAEKKGFLMSFYIQTYINFVFEVKIPVSFTPVNPVTSGCLLLTYEVGWDHVGAFLKDNTVHIAKDIFFWFLFKHKIQKKTPNQKTTGFTTITIIINMQESVFQHKNH